MEADDHQATAHRQHVDRGLQRPLQYFKLPVDVNTDSLFKSFMDGFKQYGQLWEKIIPTPEYIEISKLKNVSEKRRFYYHSDLWARILSNFSVAYRNKEIDRNLIIEALIPFYHSRILSYVNKTEIAGIKEAEEYLENINRIFENEKYYLISRWDASVKRLGWKLFK